MKTYASHIYYIAFSVIFFFSSSIFGQSVRLAWSPSDNPYISHYGIYRSTNIDSSFELINTVQHPDTIYPDNNMKWDTHYYYVATSVDNLGNESNFSNMIDTTISTDLPVELISFSLSIKNNNDVILEWSTASETNSYGFELQRSEGNENKFQKIGFVRSKGTASTPKHYSYIDKDLAKGGYIYRLKQIDLDGSYQFSDTIQITVGLGMQFILCQNSPNPFNSTTEISYNLPHACHVELIVYNIFGQEVKKLVDDFQNAGNHIAAWDGKNSEGNEVTSGLYYYKLHTPNESKFRHMSLLR